jgi:mono/diheme cytochrome c family protein
VRGLSRTVSIAAIAAAAVAGAGCGTKGIAVPGNDPTHSGAVLFSERCAGCHTLSAAGTQGSGTRAVRAQGPNLDQRKVSYPDALFAIRNGGFSGSIMPQNIVVGSDALAVAQFIAKWSGTQAKNLPRPSASSP